MGMDVRSDVHGSDPSDLDSAEDARPTYRVSAYTIYPSGYDRVAVDARESWRITVIDTGDGWSVRWRSRCLNFRGTWEFEPPRASRTPAFLTRCRFSEHAAVQRARSAVDDLVVDGMTYDEFVEQVREEAMAKAQAELRKERRSLLALFQRAG